MAPIISGPMQLEFQIYFARKLPDKLCSNVTEPREVTRLSHCPVSVPNSHVRLL